METGDSSIPWDGVLKKEARGIDDYDLGFMIPFFWRRIFDDSPLR
jgi:hypothetical protein